jgi:hypothetical protein
MIEPYVPEFDDTDDAFPMNESDERDRPAESA